VARDCGLVATDLFLEIADADLTPSDPREQAQSGGIAKSPADGGDGQGAGRLDSGHGIEIYICIRICKS
jgi:hypothetical protein